MKIFSARECEVKDISNEEAFSFIQANHRQGATADSRKSVSLGLFKDKTLLAVVQFSAPRTADMARKYTVELLRLAFAKDVRVRGGASKLIRSYIKLYNPSDFFTYQDMRGEATSVYEHAGMTLVSQAKKKDYLVAPGKTLETGSRREVLGMAYATRYGPDRILGTKLGEVYREDGTRKSNKDIFLDELGWHIESTAGDRVYEWTNPEISFYVYRTTASDSEKYYIGVKRLAKNNPTEDDCLKDGYLGSGGKNANNKFRNWLKLHKATAVKEIISIHSTRREAFAAEKIEIGDSWRDDPLCLNSRSGGAVSPPAALENKGKSHCSIHGLVGHVSGKCRSCILDALGSTAVCSKHGETSFFGVHCRKCLIESSFTTDVCDEHGATLFQGKKCLKCETKKKISMRKCSTHGESLHIGPTCALCTSAKVFTTQKCSIHGETKFVGKKCSKCMHGSAFYMATCEKHGETKHKGGKCYKCNLAKSWSKRDCSVHGEAVTFQGESCLRCRREAAALRR